MFAALGAGIPWLHSLNAPPQYSASAIVVLRSDGETIGGHLAEPSVNVEQLLKSPLVTECVFRSAVPNESGASLKAGANPSSDFRKHLTIRPLDAAGNVAEITLFAPDPDAARNVLQSYLQACVSVVGRRRPALSQAEQLPDHKSLVTLGEEIRRCLAQLDLMSRSTFRLLSQGGKATNPSSFANELSRTCELLKETLQKIDQLLTHRDRSPSGFEVLTSLHVSKTSAARWTMPLVWGGLVGTVLGLALTWSSRRPAPSGAVRRRGKRSSPGSAADRPREAASVLMHFTGTAERVLPAVSGFQPALEVFHSPHSATAENYRALRALLRHRLTDPSHAHLGLIDVEPSADGLVVAANLAASFALGGRRTLLIDCVRKVSDRSQSSPPQLSVGEFFGAKPEESLRAALGGACELTDAVAATSIEGLSIAHWSMTAADSQICPLGGAAEALREKFDVTLTYLSCSSANGFADDCGIIDDVIRLVPAAEATGSGDSAGRHLEAEISAHNLGTIIYGVGKSADFAAIDAGRQNIRP